MKANDHRIGRACPWNGLSHKVRMSIPQFHYFNTLRPRLNRGHFADDIFKCIFLNENVLISIKISLKFVSNGPINNIPALVQIKAWRRPGDKPLSEPMMVRSTTHICVTRPQWVKRTTALLNVCDCKKLHVSTSVGWVGQWTNTRKCLRWTEYPKLKSAGRLVFKF